MSPSNTRPPPAAPAAVNSARAGLPASSDARGAPQLGSSFPRVVDLVLRIVPAAIMGQTLFFKFSGDPTAVALFTKLGVEPWGRLLTGGLEAVSLILLLVPASAFFGALLALGLMGGALFSHLTVLGLEVEHDGGLLFMLALVTALTAALVAFGRRRGALALLRAKGLPLPAWLG